MFNNTIQLNLPSNSKFLVWLSHDVDRVSKKLYHSLYYGLKGLNFYHLKSLFARDDPYWNFERIMTIENKYDVKSTFFFLNESMKPNIFNPKNFITASGRYNILGDNIRKIIVDLDNNGWEIGMHGSFYSYQDINLLQKEKNVLEEILNHKVEGTRQHYLNLNIPQTWQDHKNLGFKYDASFGSTTCIGFKDEIFYPFKPFNDSFTVFPVCLMDKILFQGSKSIDEIWNNCVDIINIAEEKKTILSVIWHQRVFNEQEFPGYTEIYERLIEECSSRGAGFCTGINIFNFIK